MKQEKRDFRLQISVTLEEMKAIEDFRFSNRLDNLSAAVRKLLVRGMAANDDKATSR